MNLLRRLPGAGLLNEAWHATQLAGALAEKKKAERALVLAEENAKLAPYRGKKANEKLKELFEKEKYSDIVQLYVPYPIYKTGQDLVNVWWKTWDIYWIFLLLRIILTLWSQPGYIHPDEYFQTVEVISGDILGLRTTRTWEFNATNPIRSMTMNMIILGGPLYILKAVDYAFNFFTGWTLIGPYVIQVIPRLVMLCLSFISDFTIYQICILYKHSFNQCLTTLASSYVMLIYSTRTLTNSIEMAMTSLMIYLVAHCLKRTSETVYLQAMVHESYVKAESAKEKAKIKKKEKLIPPHDFKFFLPISILVAMGIFNRPTFGAFAVVPLFYWFQRGVATNSIVSPFQMFNFRMVSLAPGVLLVTLTLILSDSLYYGELTFRKLWDLSMDWSDWKVAPFQFLMYNVVPGNLDKHGTHPHWLHALVNLPLLYGPLGLCAIISAINFLAEIVMNDWKNKPGVRNIYAMTMFTFIVALGALSIFPHQEPRFLIPLTVPIVLMNSHKLRWKCGNYKPLLVIWYAFNISAAVFYGLAHQAGVTPSVRYIAKNMEFKTSEANFVWSNTYMPPTFELLRMSEKSRRSSYKPSYFLHQETRVNFHDLQGKNLYVDVKNEILQLATRAKLKKNQVENYLVIPSHLLQDLESVLGDDIKFTSVAYFFPHLSMEALPDLSEEMLQLLDTKVIDQGIFTSLMNILGHFGLSIYKFESQDHDVEATIKLKKNVME